MRFLSAILLATFAFSASAAVTVRDAWVRGTVPGQDTTVAYMKLSASASVALVRASTPVAKSIELHSMRLESGVMRMRGEARLELPAGKTVELAPSGQHLMLMGLARPLAAGETVPLELTFEDANGSRSTVQVSAKVQPLSATGANAPPGHDMAGHTH